MLLQPLLVNEQLKQLCVEVDVNGSSKTSYFEDGTSSSSDGDECYISIGVYIFLTKLKLSKM